VVRSSFLLDSRTSPTTPSHSAPEPGDDEQSHSEIFVDWKSILIGTETYYPGRWVGPASFVGDRKPLGNSPKFLQYLLSVNSISSMPDK